MPQQPTNPHQPPGVGAAGTVFDEHGMPRGYNLHPDWEVTPRQVKTMLDGGEELILIDCRTHQEHQVARIESAVLVPLQELGGRLGELEEYADKKVVVYCHHGGRSLKMATVLRQQGFEDVNSMAGGIDLWAMDVDTTIKRY